MSPERALGVLADRHVQARHGAAGVSQGEHVGDGHLGSRGDLFVGRILRELGRQLALDPSEPTLALLDVDGQADRPRRVAEPALDALADPERRVGRELEALAPVELLGRPDQTERALLDEVAQRESESLVATGLGDDEPEVGVDQPVLGLDVPRSIRLASSISSGPVRRL